MSTQIVCPYNNLPCRTGFCREGVCNVLEIMKHPDGHPQPTSIGAHQINQNPLIIGTVSANPITVAGHPEKTCQICGNYNPVWRCHNKVFNEINGSPNGIICPACFAKKAEEKGIEILFRVEVGDEFTIGQAKDLLWEHEESINEIKGFLNL